MLKLVSIILFFVISKLSMLLFFFFLAFKKLIDLGASLFFFFGCEVKILVFEISFFASTDLRFISSTSVLLVVPFEILWYIFNLTNSKIINPFL